MRNVHIEGIAVVQAGINECMNDSLHILISERRLEFSKSPQLEETPLDNGTNLLVQFNTSAQNYPKIPHIELDFSAGCSVISSTAAEWSKRWFP